MMKNMIHSLYVVTVKTVLTLITVSSFGIGLVLIGRGISQCFGNCKSYHGDLLEDLVLTGSIIVGIVSLTILSRFNRSK